MAVIPSGMAIEVKLLQPVKALFPMFFTPFGMVTAARLLHL